MTKKKSDDDHEAMNKWWELYELEDAAYKLIDEEERRKKSYDDLETNKYWSRLYELADVASKMYEEEQGRKISEDDLEASKNKWWKLYEMADVAAKLFDEEQRKKKGKAKIVSEEEEEEDKSLRYLDNVPKKIRSALRYPEQRFENLNGASTSSSTVHHLDCVEPRSSLHHKMAETKIPGNPDSQYSQSWCTSRKRRAVEPQTRSSSRKLKKAEVASLPRMDRETPEWIVQLRINMNRAEDPRLIFERSLFASDVHSGQSRLLMPFNLLTRNDFLTPAESRAIERKDLDDELIGLGTILVNESSQTWGLRFKIWVMEKKNSGNGTLNYALNWGWNDVVRGNDLKAGDGISIWSFRCCGLLCFALEHTVSTLPGRKD